MLLFFFDLFDSVYCMAPKRKKQKATPKRAKRTRSRRTTKLNRRTTKLNTFLPPQQPSYSLPRNPIFQPQKPIYPFIQYAPARPYYNYNPHYWDAPYGFGTPIHIYKTKTPAPAPAPAAPAPAPAPAFPGPPPAPAAPAAPGPAAPGPAGPAPVMITLPSGSPAQVHGNASDLGFGNAARHMARMRRRRFVM